MDKIQALSVIVAEAKRGELVFSTNVAASLKLQKALDDPDFSADAASKLVMNDPLLSARVVAVANSASYNHSGNPATSVKAAVARIGSRTLRAIIASTVVRQLAGASKSPHIRQLTQQLWEHTAQVAAMAQVIARRVTKLDPETALFAGIVHEVGGFYLLSRADEYPMLLDQNPPPLTSVSADGLPSFGDSLIDKETAEASIGRVVLDNLMLPQPVREAVESLWIGLRAMPPETLGDTLLLANDLSITASPLDMRSDTGVTKYPSEINFDVGSGSLTEILKECEQEVSTLTAALLV
jgi:HD-like signal output (HDOD) protein